MTLEELIARLDRHGQRATYGAVGAVVGRLARSVMSGRVKEPRNSWVVSKQTGLPTRYSPAQTDPRLTNGKPPLDTEQELRRWLSAHS
jgi:hypothetical protein